MLRIATWNVNGIRARWSDVVGFAGRFRPDILCLQEIKASAAQIPEPLTGLPRYLSMWHGGPRGYSGVSLHVARDRFEAPVFSNPEFDVEGRIVQADVGELSICSVYVHNGHKDLDAKMRFLAALRDYARAARTAGKALVICGDLNVTRSDMDVCPEARKPGSIGQSAAERAELDAILKAGYRDVLRESAPDDAGLFTWWPPWRQEKAKNRGWRIDYALVPDELGDAVRRVEVLRDEGTSDHAPVIVDLEL